MSAAPFTIGWRVADVTARDALTVGRQEVGQYAHVLEGDGALYQAVKAGTGASCWSEAADGSSFSASEIANDSGVTGTNADDALEALAPASRSFSQAPTVVATGLLLVENTAYWVYLGYFPKAVTVKRIRWHVVTGGSGAQTAEVALASSPAAPSRANQSLTKIAAQAVAVTDLTGTGLQANDSDLNTAVPAGTHLWAGIRTAMATDEPTLLARAADFGQGQVLSTAAAGVLTGAGPWTGAVIAHALTAQAPILVATLD